MTWLMAFVLLAAGGPSSKPGEMDDNWLTPEQAMNLGRKLSERLPFLKSEDVQAKETMGLFFGRKDYELIKGNPVFGYWGASGFKWVGKKVAWGGVASKGMRCKAISEKAWNAAFSYVVKKHGLLVEADAPMKFQGACVYAVVSPSKTERHHGLVMELKLESPTGIFRYRYSRANPTLEDAIGSAIELPILLAQKILVVHYP